MALIDNPEQTMRLMARLEQALPLPALLTPEVAATLREKFVAANLPRACTITWITYMGDEGGIVCKLNFGIEMKNEAFLSITHLRFDARLPMARELATYQKRRVKRLQPGYR